MKLLPSWRRLLRGAAFVLALWALILVGLTLPAYFHLDAIRSLWATLSDVFSHTAWRDKAGLYVGTLLWSALAFLVGYHGGRR
ncbi:MAG: hypothetical protein AB2A00_36130 [Myxococcota bacterium]